MADPVKTNERQGETRNGDVDRIALTIFAERAARGPMRRDGEAEAANAYRQADAFLKAQAKFRSGELSFKKPEGPQLCECSAPNLPETHPHNLVSKRFGDLERVKTLKAWLDLNPTPAGDPTELVTRFNKAFKGLDWDLAAVGTARTIFSSYVS